MTDHTITRKVVGIRATFHSAELGHDVGDLYMHYQYEDMVRELVKVHAMLDGAGVPPMADAPGRLAARIAYLLTVWQGAETRAGAYWEMYKHACNEWQVLELAASAAMEETE